MELKNTMHAVSTFFEIAGVTVIVAGFLVAIRTFLSWSLEVEIEGHWPWHRHRCGDGEA